MPYNTNLPHRRSPRLRGYDYTLPGWYFVTICTANRACLFGEISDDQMNLNPWGRIAEKEWRRTATLRDRVHLDAYVVMPNHVHGLIGIADEDDPLSIDEHRDRWNEMCRNTMNGAVNLPSWRIVEEGDKAFFRCRDTMHRVPAEISDLKQAEWQAGRFGGSVADSLSTIIGTYKAAVTRCINRIIGATDTGHSVWQPRFHDHIIRNENEWYAVRQYIRQNPANWKGDRLNPIDPREV